MCVCSENVYSMADPVAGMASNGKLLSSGGINQSINQSINQYILQIR